MKHKTIKMSSKTFDVDKGIAPVVTWLNSFQDVNTLWACESQDWAPGGYVIFLCTDVDTLRTICQCVHSVPFVGIDIKIDLTEFMDFRYTLYFNTVKNRIRFIKKGL